MAEVPALHFFLWMSPNSSQVLGQGQTTEAALRDAGMQPGFPVTVTLSYFPPGSNPLIGVADAFRGWRDVRRARAKQAAAAQGARAAPPPPVAPPVRKRRPKAPKVEGSAPVQVITTPKVVESPAVQVVTMEKKVGES